MNIKNVSKRSLYTGLVAISMLIGVTGGTLINGVAHAQTATTQPAVTTAVATTPATTGSTATVQNGTFKSNEDPTHEAGESAAREAQEDAGQRPTAQ